MTRAKRPFTICGVWDAGFMLLFDGKQTWHSSFFDAFRVLELGPLVLIANVFDRAYRSDEVDTALRFDGDRFTVELQGGQTARVDTIDDAQAWLDAQIRLIWPASAYAYSGTA
jgi:hypothetical protein